MAMTGGGVSAPLGGLHCQRDSYAQERRSTVVRSAPAPPGASKKAKDLPGIYAVVLDDTVLFPEGGGQPSDLGEIDGLPVVDVQRVGNECVHYVQGDLPVGKEVTVRIDWSTRFDHMQHHSGQHLLSAVITREFGFKTVSWNLGETICQVELDTPTLTQEQIDRIEAEVNREIRACKPLLLKDWSQQQAEAGTRITVGSEASAGPIRLIQIQGVDECTCCGTHVSNTSELQAIKLLHTEKTRGNTRLYFVVGNRFLRLTHKMLENERILTQLLNVGPSGHAEAVERTQKQVQTLRKSLKGNVDEISELLAQKISSANQGSSAGVFFHREDGDNDFVSGLSKALGETLGDKRLIFVSAGDASKKGDGIFLLTGPTEKVDQLGPSIAKTLNAKGGGKKGRFQAKGTGFSDAALKEAQAAVEGS